MGQQGSMFALTPIRHLQCSSCSTDTTEYQSVMFLEQSAICVESHYTIHTSEN